MDFLPKNINDYSENHTSPESELLANLNRETHAKILQSRMLSGHLQGRVLSMFSHMMQAKTILEIGTYTGYSALCLAEGLVEGGKIITIDINEELESFTKQFFLASDYAAKIDYRIGDAAEIIPMLDETFDLVFIDADKMSYQKYYDLVFDKVRKGGYIISDNVLWSGKVANIEPNKKIDKDTQNLLDFNKMCHEDPRTENILMPIRDGLMVCRKK
ncbi:MULTISPECIES: class I SAM-dependent methyltransferase [unclassified Arcicella]|uniref:O-methyltransferase n=1 Tax=unclassified Arcicella TaxID=2644986 RepID=UPI0028653178|nr:MULTISPECIES: class I SAM-dependent methyltransferase [unclassified Arcicella]MDR6564778.1 putative O-methyltransferase YrrM [Arcicella sp. BE51]MDR6814574.1 putative O-methyltransferase YrrM [Arcicella sp. BE140]MDR6825952.1 putative O-methyltransferase YrrM [Arcicella sp. BE139]